MHACMHTYIHTYIYTYQGLRYKQLKENVMQDVKKELDLSFRQRLSNIELHFYERIAQLESLVENTNKLQTDQLLKELDAKNNILTKLLVENILRKFSNTPSQNDIIGGLTRQPCNNLKVLHKVKISTPQYSTRML